MKETGLSIHATGDESLGELVSLWRSGHTGGYSREFLAGTICADLGLLRRFVHTAAESRATSMRTEHPQIQEAQTLVAQDTSVVDTALEGLDSQEFLERVRMFVRSAPQKPEEDRAEEGFDLLCGCDELHLLLQVLTEGKVSTSSRMHLRQQEHLYRQITRTIEDNRLAFFAAAPMVNGYCLAWNVEEDSILSRVARLGSREAEMLWAELSRALDPIPVATPTCPDENQVALAFAGQLVASEQESFNRHLTGCGHCRSLLDLLAATFARLPAEFPVAPQSVLPRELRQPGLLKKLRKSLQQITKEISERVREFFVPSSVLSQPVLVRGEAASAPLPRFDEILQRDVLIESPDVQAVLFPRGRKLYLSALGNRPQTVHSLRLIDMQTQSAWPAEKIDEEGTVCLGEATDLCNKQLQISFRVGKKRYQIEVRIRAQGGSQA